MRWIKILRLRLRTSFRRDQVERELDEELRYHLGREIVKNLAGGMAPEQARWAALNAMGGLEQRKEECRDTRGFVTIDAIRRDVGYAIRVMWKTRTATLAAFVTMALAMGATTAMFTVVDALLLRSLPFPEADRLVQVGRTDPDLPYRMATERKFIHWHKQGRQAFIDMAAYRGGQGFNLVGSGRPERLTGAQVSASFFEVMGVQPALGRAFRTAEDIPEGPRLVVLSHALWTNRFGARTDIVGQAVTLNTEPYTVIGVMPAGFRYPDVADLWTLLQADPASQNPAPILDVIGRLKPETTLDQAHAAMEIVGSAFRRANPDLMDTRETVGVWPLREQLYGDMRPALLILLASVGFVLVIACVNVANLQLAQATERHHEMALRTALGATKWAVVRQLLVESVLLAAISGVAGVGLAYVGIPALLALNPAPVPYADTIAVDWRVLGVALAISLLVGVAFGLLPAWQAARPTVDDVLRAGAHRMIGRTSRWTRRTLVGGEVALALMLTIAALLLVKSLAALHATKPGVVVENVLTMKLPLPEARYGSGKALAQLQARLEERLGALPGVRAAGVAHDLPLEFAPGGSFTIESRYVPGTQEGVGFAQGRKSSTGYFDALQIPVRRGRVFDVRDRRNTRPVVIINEAAARQFWPGENPIGERLTLGQPDGGELAERVPREIVGIVGNVRDEGLAKAPPPVLYRPLSQLNDAQAGHSVGVAPFAVIVRGEATAALTRSVHGAIWSVDPQQPVTDVRLMREVVTDTLGAETFNAALLGGLAALALLLAAVGLYGVIAHLVSQHTREIGVRMALGATRASVVGLFLRQALFLVAVGVTVGLAGAFGVTRVLRTLLTGISTTDPWVFMLAPALMIGVAILAALRPALRAARVDPTRALRAE